MAETKHKTTLEIGVDDRALKELAESMDRALSTRTADAFEKSLERTSKALGKLVDQQAKMLKLQTDQAKLNRGGRGGGGRGGDEDTQRTRDADRGMWERFKQSDTYRAGHTTLSAGSRAGTTLVGGEGAFTGALSAIPFVGPIIGAAMGAAQGFYGSHVAHQSAEAAAFGQTGLAGYGSHDRGTRGFNGVRYGVMPTELPGLVSEFMQGAQLRGDTSNSRYGFEHALDMNKLTGIGLGTSGGFMQAQSLLGNRERNSHEEMQTLQEALSEGMAMGIRESRLDQYIQQMTGAIDDMQNRGILISPTSIVGMVHGLGQLGGAFRGQAGVNAALGMTNAMQNVGNRGNLFGMLALQEAGYGRGSSYMEARHSLETEPSRFAGALIGRVNRMGGDSEARAYMMQQQFREIGLSLSTQQAMQLAGMTQEQSAGFSGEGGGQRFQEYLAQAQGQGGFGAAAAAAGLEYQRSGAGSEVAGPIAELLSTEISISRQFLPEIAGFVRDTARYTEELLGVFHEGGFSAVVGRLFQDVGNVIGNAVTNAIQQTPQAAAGLINTASAGAASIGFDMASWVAQQLPDGFLRDLANSFRDRLLNVMIGFLPGGRYAIGGGAPP